MHFFFFHYFKYNVKCTTFRNNKNNSLYYSLQFHHKKRFYPNPKSSEIQLSVRKHHVLDFISMCVFFSPQGHFMIFVTVFCQLIVGNRRKNWIIHGNKGFLIFDFIVQNNLAIFNLFIVILLIYFQFLFFIFSLVEQHNCLW